MMFLYLFQDSHMGLWMKQDQMELLVNGNCGCDQNTEVERPAVLREKHVQVKDNIIHESYTISRK